VFEDEVGLEQYFGHLHPHCLLQRTLFRQHDDLPGKLAYLVAEEFIVDGVGLVQLGVEQDITLVQPPEHLLPLADHFAQRPHLLPQYLIKLHISLRGK